MLIPQATLSLFREEPEPCRAPEGFWVGVNRRMEMGLMAEQLVIGIPAPCTCQGVAGGTGWKLGQGQQWSWLLQQLSKGSAA